ncbi:MAG: glycosyltransferase [Chloroflexi bacterium]|nr:glycosyltransferase [Chloroflexota bacterium]
MLRIALIYDNTLRADTTGEHCRQAFQGLCAVTHVLPTRAEELRVGDYDLFLNVDDGLQYHLPEHLHPSAWWVIDTHLQYDWDYHKAQRFDFVFAAQRDGAQRLRADGIAHVFWLPLAANPLLHRPVPVPKSYDWCFVGRLFPGTRSELVHLLREHFPNCFVGEAYGDEMARILSASRVVFNRSLGSDVNMRVFEALACGSLLATNDLADNGLGELLRAGEHYLAYREADDLCAQLAWALARPAERERIAAAGRAAVLATHTYRHRMQTVLRAVFPEPVVVRGAAQPRVSAIVVTYNSASTLRACLDSTLASSYPSLEVVVVDNASQDATPTLLDTYAERVRVVRNAENLGFARACNQGIALAQGDYYVLLNPDTAVPRRWLERLLAHVADDVGAVGPVSNYAAGWQSLAAYPHVVGAMRAAPGPLDLEAVGRLVFGLNFRRSVEAKGLLTGFCLLLRADLVRTLGALDERFFLGHEDHEYVLRLKRAGYRVVIAADSFVYHRGHASFNTLPPGEEGRLLDESRAVLYRRVAELYGAQELPRTAALYGWDVFGAAHTGPLTSIIILTHNNLADTRACLASIREHTPQPYELIVVDNGSTDGTVEALRGEPGVRLIANAANVGFAAGCNQGLAVARGDFLLLLNNDTLATPGWLEAMLRAMAERSTLGIVGPRSNNVAGVQRVPEATEGYPEGLERFARAFCARHAGQATLVPRVIGFCMLISRVVVERIGGLDERFGTGNLEDDDYCLRARLAGFELAVVHDSYVHHHGGRTFDMLGIDYRRSVWDNAGRFQTKWGVALTDRGYEPPDLVALGFDQARDYGPLPTGVAVEEVPIAPPPVSQAAPPPRVPEELPLISWVDTISSVVATRRGGALAAAEPTPTDAAEAALDDARRLLAEERWDEALAALNRALDLSPLLSTAHYLLGYAQLQRGAAAAAVAALRQAVQQMPFNADFHNALGAALCAAGEAAAEAAFRRALDLAPERADVWSNLGELYERLRRPAEAVAAYERALAVAPDDPLARAGLERVQGGLAEGTR